MGAHITNRTLRLGAFTDILNRDWAGFTRLYETPAPNTFAPVFRIQPMRCSAPCRGGTVGSGEMVYHARILKRQVIHAFGWHSFASGDWSYSTLTSAVWESYQSVSSRNAHGEDQYLSDMAEEIREDEYDPIEERVVETVKALSRAAFGGDDDD